MARPLKDPQLRLDTPLMVMLTAQQKSLIKQAADAVGVDVSVWIRPILLKAAQQQVLDANGQRKQVKGR